MDLGLAGRVAVIGGASRGLGFAAARELAQEGARVAICSRDPEAVRSAAVSIEEATGAEVFSVVADLTEPRDVERLIERSTEALGRVDILVTNTGGPPSGPFESHSAEVWQQAIRQNFDSVVNLCRAVLPGMKDRQWGRIVNITSIAVKQPVENLILSNSLRAGVTGFARTLANEVARFGVTVNNVMPGYTATERVKHLAERLAEMKGTTPEQERARWEAETPAGRIGRPDELAALIAFLSSERAAYVTAQSIAVDGGWIRSLL